MARPRTRAMLGGWAALVVVVLLAGCQGSGSEHLAVGAEPAARAGQAAAAATTKITVTPAASTSHVALATHVTVSAADGRLTSVEVAADGVGATLDGDLSGDATTWTSSAALRPATTYTVTAEAVDGQGKTTTTTSSFSTAAPAELLTTEVAPLGGSTVGVGMPIIVYFDHTVVDKAAVERALTVTTSRPVVGSWSWLSGREVHYRPQAYWPAGTDVTLHLDFKGVDAGGGQWGLRNRSVSFHIGPSMISKVDVAAHKMTVVRYGKVIRVVPITTGKAGFLTRNGLKVIMEKDVSKVMDAQTIGIHPGDPNYYKLTVPYAMRVTNSGEFVHAAPWSVANQGLANVSHGCVGMSMANGIWFFNLSRIGDVVQVVNSPRHLEPGNGWTDWNVSWAQWKAGSALA